jgi:hypothetical protein
LNGVLLAATLLIRVTTPDGATVHINPTFITKLYSTKEAMEKGHNQLVVTGARCVITMSDNKFIAVKEPCDYILDLVEGRQPSRKR